MQSSVYVHVPFCETKCPYCDFNSFAVAGRDKGGYLDALRREMDARCVPPDPSSVFVGGGTPTVLEPDELETLFGELTSRFRRDPAREFTVEANPGSLTAEKVAVLRRFGVNRMSLGAQSFFPHHLETLGRVHGVGEIAEAYAMVREGGIERVNLDFIYAVPGMTLREWAETLDWAVAMRPDHLSCYALIFEPGTEFFARRRTGSLRTTPEELELAMFRLTERKLRAAGYPRYEISNFSHPGYECRHNIRYWKNYSYVGFGAGAYSFVDGERLGNERHLGRYAQSIRERGDAVVFRERLEGLRGAGETVALGLRTVAGVDLDQVGARYGVDVRSAFLEPVRRLREEGYLERTDPLRLARRGWRVADRVAAEFV